MRILIICDSPYLYTGLARVNRNVIRGLDQSGHEVMLGAWGWDQLAYPLNENSQWTYRDQKTEREYVAFPLAKQPEKLLIQTFEVLKSIRCDVLLTIGDYWDFRGFELLKSKLNYGYKWISYYTIESSPINEDYLNAFEYMDEIMVPSKFGASVVEKSTNKTAHHIPYGIDTEVFRPITDAKKSSSTFRFINVSKNQSRKNIPAFLEALKLVHEVDSRAIGYLHTNVDKKVPNQVHVQNIIRRLGISNIISLPKHKLALDIGCSDDDLRKEYCNSDALVLSSVAEGFGFPILEAQACGIPAIVSNCSSMTELAFYKDLLVDCIKYYGPMEQEIGIVRVDDLAEKMLHSMKTTYDGEKLFDFAKGFSWRTTNKMIDRVLNGMQENICIPAEEV